MDSRVGKPTVVDDVHADPHVHPSEYALVVLLVVLGVVEEYPVKEVLLLERGAHLHLNGMLTVAAQGRVLLLKPPCQHRAYHVLPVLQVDLQVDVAVVSR